MKPITNNKLTRLLDVLSGYEYFVFLDTAKPDAENAASLLFLDPVHRLQYRQGEDLEEFFVKANLYQHDGYYLAGWISYEFGYVIEGVLQNLLCRPGDNGALLADLGVFQNRYIFDHRSGENDFPEFQENCMSPSSCCVTNVTLSQSREDYLRAIRRILDYISAGDTYQVNYTLKLLFEFSGSAEHLYGELRRNQSVSYGAYIRLGDERILSFSPELFFRKGHDSVVVRPMKGTMKRGKTLAEDAINCSALADDIKNRSENVMIVDLLRNDLGRLMHYTDNGDVSVRSLFDVEVYETLLQMTSTITAKTTAESLAHISLLNFFKALFPCGSVTGAPKIRTMQIINELEKDRRGVYTGAIGYMAPTGEAMFNVPIRTVVLRGDHGEMGIGSGIVHDSDPEQEWQECLLKGRFLTKPAPEFQLIETLLHHPKNGYLLLEEHLQRLRASASYFLFSCDPGRIRADLLEEGRKFKGGCMRVRVLLDKDGTPALSSVPCDEPVHYRLPEKPPLKIAEMPEIIFSETRTDARSSWFYHKTTRRDLYDREFSAAGKKGLFDVCFLNADGEVTEGCITNIIVSLDGFYYTPPVGCGLLPGVMRGLLLQDRERSLMERVLTIDDVRNADAVFLCNSVRGVVQVRLLES
jgi:para-aminobenzoate synthetase / 4-amino-4-deoxychorismate lyase